MRIEVNIQKKYFFGLLAIGLIIIGIVGVFAYNSGGPASVFGHSVEEIDWSRAVPGNITASGFCIGAVCKTAWTADDGNSQVTVISSTGGGVWHLL
jgi:hypothetical protein